MILSDFAGHQNDVFLAPLVLALVAAIAVCLPIIFLPALRQRPVSVMRLAIATSAVAVLTCTAVAIPLVATGNAQLQNQRDTIKSYASKALNVAISPEQAQSLFEGGTLKLVVDDQEQYASVKQINSETYGIWVKPVKAPKKATGQFLAP